MIVPDGRGRGADGRGGEKMAQAVLVPTTAVSDRSWTVAEVEAWPVRTRFEILEGVLYAAALPLAPHADIVSNLLSLLASSVRARGLGKVYPPQTGLYHSETNYLDPDLVFLRPAQRPRKGERAAAAALAVEVVSPSNLRAPREPRERLFRQLGVEELWYVEYEARRMEVRRLTPEGYVTTAVFAEGDTVRSEVFPGLEFPLSAAWEDVRDRE
jgi:Uma2 family endonuclease